MGDITCEIFKGPYLCGANLVVECVIDKFLPSSQTFCPSLKGRYCCNLLLAFVMSSWAWRMVIWACCLICHTCLIQFWSVGNLWVFFAWWACGTYPMISSKGGALVVELGQALCTYWAMGNHFAQSSCWWLTKILRYCSSHWLVHSDCSSVWGWYAVLIFC